MPRTIPLVRPLSDNHAEHCRSACGRTVAADESNCEREPPTRLPGRLRYLPGLLAGSVLGGV